MREHRHQVNASRSLAGGLLLTPFAHTSSDECAAGIVDEKATLRVNGFNHLVSNLAEPIYNW